MAFGARPALLGERTWPDWAGVVGILAIHVLLTVVNLVLSYPRWFFWVVVVLVGVAVLAKVRQFGPVLVGASAAVAAGWYFADYWISTAHTASLGYDTSQYAISIPSLVASVGSVGLSAAICCLLDDGARRSVVSWVAPDGTVDAVRGVLVLVLVVTAFFPIVRAFSGSTSFTVVVAARDQVLFPGYASPGQVADGMKARFLREAAPVDDVRCSYFLPGVGAPPVYDCDATLRFSDGTVLHHDDIQSTGRPDGTFSCEDLTSGVRHLC